VTEDVAGDGGQLRLFVGRADGRGDHRAAGGEVALDEHFLPETDELPDQIHPAVGGRFVDDFGDGLTGELQCLGQDLVPALGEVVVHGTSRRAAASEHFVDRHPCGTTLAQHLGSTDQHVGAGRAALGAGLVDGGRQNNLQRERSGRASLLQL
jgi:hypothetical protein